MTEKILKGIYKKPYRVWKIEFPYMTDEYVFAGSKTDAEKAAMGIKKKRKFPYSPKVREVKCI